MRMNWVVIGTDMFAYEDYPKSVCERQEECLALAAIYNAAQPAKQPGGLPDRFSVLTMREAMRRCDMSATDLVAFVRAIRDA